MRSTTGLRAIGLASLIAIAAASIVPASAAASSSPTTTLSGAQRVVSLADAQLSKRYVFGASGPSAFDCSGLVLYVFEHAGAGGRIGGGHSALGMYRWFAARGQASLSNLQVGDLVIYGGGSHVAIYIGQGRVISALNPWQGIRITGLHALGSRVTAYLHTHLTAFSGGSTRATGHSGSHHALARIAAVAAAHVRSGHSSSAAILGTVYPGTRFSVLGSTVDHGSTWYRIAFQGRTAWVWAHAFRAV